MRLNVSSPVKGIHKIEIFLPRFLGGMKLYFDNKLVHFKRGAHAINTYAAPNGNDIHFHVKRPLFTFFPVLRFENEEVRFARKLTFPEITLIYLPFLPLMLLGAFATLGSAIIFTYSLFHSVTFSIGSLYSPNIFTYFVLISMTNPFLTVYFGLITIWLGAAGMFANSLLIRISLPVFFRFLYCICLSVITYYSLNYLFLLFFKRPILPV